jgi:hypothetical protein
MLFSAAALVKNSATQMVYKNRNKVPDIRPTARMVEAMKRQYSSTQPGSKVEMGGSVNIEHNNSVNTVCFSVDEVRASGRGVQLVEHKYIDSEELPEWFLHQSLIQVAFYGTLALRLNKLRTAKFHSQQTGIVEEVSIRRATNTVSLEEDRPFFSRTVTAAATRRLPFNEIEVEKPPLIVEQLLVFTRDNKIECESCNIDSPATIQMMASRQEIYTVSTSEEVLDFYSAKAYVVATNNYTNAKAFDEKYKWKEWELLKDSFKYKRIA